MIIKILTRHSPSYSSLIKYILQERKSSQVITHNIRSKAQDDIVKEFIENEALRKYPRKGNIMMYHEILSLSANEDKTKITGAMLNDLAQQYISLRGSTGIFVGAAHKDKEHIHIHFCSGGTEFRTGKSFRLSKSELKNLKVSFQNYHLKKYPELTMSTVPHGQKRPYETSKEWQLEHQAERKSIKEQIRKTVAECFVQAKTQKDFLESLRDNNLHYYERNSVPIGLQIGEIKFRFTRLGISKEEFDRLPNDRTEEQKALSTIRRIIMSKERSKEIDGQVR